MTLHVVYRSHGGENAKGRPEWYSKVLALQSFARALETARAGGRDVEVLFLNDGPIPAGRTAIMAGLGEQLTIQGGSNRRSYLQALAVARRRGWNPQDAVLLVEDDYLWVPEALEELLQTMATHPGVDYFAPYGTHHAPPQRRWITVESTTSTFAVRIAALLQDERLMILCAYSGADFDRTTCLTLQGVSRYPLPELFRHDPLEPGTARWKVAARWAYLAVMRAAVDLRAVRRPSRRRRLLAAEPSVATHMELGWMGAGDWATLAAETGAWAAAQPAGSGQR